MKIKARVRTRDIIVKIIGFIQECGIVFAIGVDEDGDIDGYNIEDVQIIDSEYLP